MPLVKNTAHRQPPEPTTRRLGWLRARGGLRPRLLLRTLWAGLSVTLLLALIAGLLAWQQQAAHRDQALRMTVVALADTLASPSPVGAAPVGEPTLELPDPSVGEDAVRRGPADAIHQVDVVDPEGMPLHHWARGATGPLQSRPAPAGLRLRPPAGALPQPSWWLERLAATGPTATEAGDPSTASRALAHGRLAGWRRLGPGPESPWLRVQDDGPSPLSAALPAALRALGLGLLLNLGLLALQWQLLASTLQRLVGAQRYAAGLALNDGQRLVVRDGADELVALENALNVAGLRLAQQRQTIDTAISELTQNEVELSDANEQLNTIFSLSPDGLLSVDITGRVRYANATFARLFGLSRRQLLDIELATLDALLQSRLAPGGDWPGLAALLDQPRDAAPPDTSVQDASAHKQVLEIAGPPRLTVELSCVTHTSDNVHHLLYLRDVTARVAVERMKSEFLSTAAHELRTPLASIYAFTELLITRDFPRERQRDFLAKTHRQAAAVVAILNELLDLARIEARGGQDFNFRTIDLGDLIEQSLVDFSVPEGRAAPLWLRPLEPMPARADSSKLAQVLGNLLSNAYKYSPGGGEVSVRLLYEVEDAGASALRHPVIEVRDAGMGMSPEQLARVCERFYRADASGKVPGTGLGMAIVKEIIELHGGTLHISSEPGRGTCVRCSLKPMLVSEVQRVVADDGIQPLPSTVDPAATHRSGTVIF